MLSFRPLKAEEVEVRVNQCTENGVSLLLYKDARCDMRILDETVGPEYWECYYEAIDGKLFCTVGIYVFMNPDDKYRTKVDKQDVGVPSNMESTKGEASDAFKRACFKWGIGRELYTAPRIWVGSENCNVKQGRNGNWQCYDDFRVTDMEVDEGRITRLTIANMSKRGLVVYGQGKGKSEVPANNPLKEAKQRLWKSLQGYAERHGRTGEEILAGVKKRPEWEAQHESAEWLLSVAREFEEADG